MAKSLEFDDSLSKLVNKAKRKLNKLGELEEKRNNSDSYVFLKYENNEEMKKLEKKIVQIIKNNPDCVDPIGRLIDHKIYDELTDSQKQNYVLKLSAKYREVCESLS